MATRQFKMTSGSLSVSLLLPTLFLAFYTVLFWHTPVSAETRFVKPSSEVVVRRGQGNDYKIIAMVKDGDSVEFIEEGEDYAKVRLADGKEGWMLKRFLSNDPPLQEIVASLRTDNKEMKQKTSEAVQKLEEVTSTLARTEMELTSTLAERDKLWNDFQLLQRDTANVVQIKKDLSKTTQQNELLLRELASAKEENNSLKQNKTIKWFLAGAGVLLLGILIGKIPSQPRRKKSLL